MSGALTVRISPSSPVTICAGGILALNATPSDGSGIYTTYQWRYNDEDVSSDSTYVQTLVSESNSGTYTVTVTDSDDNTASASVVVNVLKDVPCIQRRCARPRCVIDGTSTITHLVNNPFSPVQYYNNGGAVTVDGATAGAPNHQCIPDNLCITIGCESAKDTTVSSSEGGGAFPLVDSALHYEFEEGLRITETESTITIYYPGSITISKEIETDKDLFIMSVAGYEGIVINANITARNIVMTAMAGKIKVESGCTITSQSFQEMDISATADQSVSDAHLCLFAYTICIEGSLATTSSNGFTVMIANSDPVITGVIHGNFVVNTIGCRGARDVYYVGGDQSVDHTTLECGVAINITTTGDSAPFSLVNDGARIFIDTGTDWIIVHDGDINLPDLSDGLDRNLFVVTPCNINFNTIKTFVNNSDETKNVTLIAGNTISGYGIDSASENHLGGVCTLIGCNVVVMAIIFPFNTSENNGRIFCISALDMLIGIFDTIDSISTDITFNAGGNFFTFIGIVAQTTTKDIIGAASTINILAGLDIMFFIIANASISPTAPGGNILMACGGSINNSIGFDYYFFYDIIDIESSYTAAGNLFVTAGGEIDILAILLGGTTDGRAVFISGGVTNLGFIGTAAGDGLIEIYSLCVSNNPVVDAIQFLLPHSTLIAGITLVNEQNNKLWASSVGGARATVSATPNPACTGSPVILESTIEDTNSQWTLTKTPCHYDGPKILSPGMTAIFTPNVPGTYVAYLSTGPTDFVCGYDQACGITIEIYEAPSVSLETPEVTALCGNTPFILTANASGGSEPYTYTWSMTSTDNTFKFITPNVSGSYNCHVSVTDQNGCTVTASEVVSMTVTAFSEITTQPQSQTVRKGETLTLSIVGIGDGLSYQWQKDDEDIAHATDSIYTKENAGVKDSGHYTVKITRGEDCIVTSDIAVIRVRPDCI